MARYTQTFLIGAGEHRRRLEISGRAAWALTELVKAGPAGLTTLERPAPRWSHYVYQLKRVHGINIETQHERHGGEFAGNHGRYIVHTPVSIFAEE
jgi:hypothetical protein